MASAQGGLAIRSQARRIRDLRGILDHIPLGLSIVYSVSRLVVEILTYNSISTLAKEQSGTNPLL